MSTDQFFINTPGRLTNGDGNKYYSSYSSSFHVGILYNDVDTRIIWVENQVYLGASEINLGKERLEQWIW